MHYDYVGWLEELSSPSAEQLQQQVPQIVFGPKDLAQWPMKDLPSEKEWNDVPAHRLRRDTVIRFSGRFEEQRKIDSLPPDYLGYWVALGTLGWKDERIPIDLDQFPVLEITYRCLTENAIPVLLCLFPGSERKIPLPAAPGWRTAAVLLSRQGFPARLDTIILRLYSTVRATATLEVERVRVRALYPHEENALDESCRVMADLPRPPDYSVFHDVLPLGVFMDAASARRISETLEISLTDYWWMALEDVVKHHHNAVAITNLGILSQGEQTDLFEKAEKYGVRLVVAEGFCTETDPQQQETFFVNQAAALASSNAVLAWQLFENTLEKDIPDRVRFRQLMEKADPRHPLAVTTSDLVSVPSLSRYFAAVSFCFSRSHVPWDLGTLVATHATRSECQQLWVYAPAYVGPTGAPAWSTCPEIRMMVNLGFASGARGWFSYAYHNEPAWDGGVLQRTLTGPFLAFSDLWAELDIDMNLYSAIAPLLLHARPAEWLPEWDILRARQGENASLPDNISPVTATRLRGLDYDILFFVSDDTRGMTSVDIDVPESLAADFEIHDLGDFVRTRKWEMMPLQRHIEMFPGQARILLIARAPVCAWWRNLIAARLVDDDRRQIHLNMDLARAYGLDTRPVEELVSSTDADDVIRLQSADRASALLTDLLYSVPAAATARSAVIEALAILCACDGALCRLMDRGKPGQAQDVGRRLLPLAREVTGLRVALRKGEGGAIGDRAQKLVDKARELLVEIRSLMEPPQERAPFSRRTF